MPSLAEYFAANRYKARYEIGDRVFGYYKKIPFIGSVGNDTLINEEEGPRVSIHLDLPIKVDNAYKTVIIVKHKDIKSYLKDFASEAEGIAGASKTPGSGFKSRLTHQKKTTSKKK
jgi:hypothetical protein